MNTVDPLVTCPYNLSHQILKSRMQYHLVKCRKSNPTIEKEVCPFDATHHVPKPEFRYHIRECPNRKIVECHTYVTADSSDSVRKATSYKQPALPLSEENWDEDTIQSSYQPLEKAAEKNVLRSLTGATKSERKAFRLQERRRVQHIQETGSVDDDSAGAVGFTPRQKDAPLRRPYEPVHERMGLGRGAAHQQQQEEQPSLGNLLEEFTALSMSRGRGTGARPKNGK